MQAESQVIHFLGESGLINRFLKRKVEMPEGLLNVD